MGSNNAIMDIAAADLCPGDNFFYLCVSKVLNSNILSIYFNQGLLVWIEGHRIVIELPASYLTLTFKMLLIIM